MAMSFTISPVPGRDSVLVQERNAEGKALGLPITVPGGHSLQRVLNPGHTFEIKQKLAEGQQPAAGKQPAAKVSAD